MNDFQNSRRHLVDIVEPNLMDAEHDDLSFRKIYNLLASVDSLMAQIFWELDERKRREWCLGSQNCDDTRFREELSKRFPDIRLLRDIAKAQKHIVLLRGAPLVNKADELINTTLGYGEGAYGEGPYGGGNQIIVEMEGGHKRNVIGLAKNALKIIQNEFGL